MAYFWTPKPIGLKADIERHRKAQQELEDNISELESQPESTYKERYLRTYRNMLCILLQSRAEVVTKIGRK